MTLDVNSIIEQLKGATILELNDLVKAIEDEFNVSASAPVAVASAGNNEEAAEKDSFDVELTSIGQQKIKVIKAVREITGKGLKESKDIVDKAPSIIKESASKDEADDIKSKLEEVGATVTLK